MKMTRGVGLSDLAFHRSITLNFLSLPYTTLVMSGGVVEAGFFGGGSAESRMPGKSIIGSRACRRVIVFMGGSIAGTEFRRAASSWARPAGTHALPGSGQLG